MRGSSEAGGAGVSRSERTSEKVFACGTGRVTSELGPGRSASQGTERDLECVADGRLPEEGSEDGGYRSKSNKISSTMSWRVQTSPGRLSE